MPDLKHEIEQLRSFSSAEEEALLNLLRTADCLQRAMQRTTRQWRITVTQYNVLRILRGAHPQGLTCSAIGERMITSDPDITRLLGRLKAMKLVHQQRGPGDRRVVWTHISPAGLKLLAEMDDTVQRAPKQMLGHLSAAQVADLIRLLELARAKCGDAPAPVNCDGKDHGGETTCDLAASGEPALKSGTARNGE